MSTVSMSTKGIFFIANKLKIRKKMSSGAESQTFANLDDFATLANSALLEDFDDFAILPDLALWAVLADLAMDLFEVMRSILISDVGGV